MTETERKALALMNEVRLERGIPAPDYLSARAALIRAIEQHEAFRQEVSDVISELSSEYTSMGDYYADKLQRLVITKPDPIAEAWVEATGNSVGMLPVMQALAARGLKITNI